MLDFIYHMTLNIFEIKFCLSEKANDLMILTYRQCCYGSHFIALLNMLNTIKINTWCYITLDIS